MSVSAPDRQAIGIRINSNRLWDRLMEMAKIGATPAGGCARLALTELDRQGRDLFCSWVKSAGCTITVDQMGNIWARREGRDPNAPPIVTGSHLDTQPTGGKFDGVYGVLAGLEVIETLNDHQIETEHPVEVVVWTNEEGVRFEPAMIGSGVYGGAFSLEDAHGTLDDEGISLGNALKSIGYDGEADCSPKDIKAAFEAHIEQGPILEAEGRQVGIVKGVQGMRWFKAHLTGQPVHAGPTPMSMRKDPMKALSKLLQELYRLTHDAGEHARVTFGDVSARPGATNTVPEIVTLSIDLRHPDEAVLSELEEQMRGFAAKIADETGVAIGIEDVWKSPAVEFDQNCVAAVREATKQLEHPNFEMISGAGHDSVYLARVAPTSMIFVPCKDGISHNEAEYANQEDLSAGADVLLRAILLSD